MKSKNNLRSNSRRELLKAIAGIPLLAPISAVGKKLSAVLPDDSVERNISFNSEQVQEVKKKLPQGKIGNLNISRIILGCNPIIAWSHARDLSIPTGL